VTSTEQSKSDLRMYFHFRSPYSRFGLHRIAQAGLDPDLMVFTGPPKGNEFRDPMKNPAIVRYVLGDVPRLGKRLGLAVKRPKPFDVNFAPASRSFVLAKAAGKGLEFALGISDVRWGNGKDISDLETIREVASGCGLDPSLVDEAQDHPQVRAAFDGYRDRVEEDGAFGVPFIVSGRQAYWGQDRIDLLLEDLGLD
jgi:2-hydroxychromene-2-carboxylate isomerase